MPERRCVICGCTEFNACLTDSGPCYWVTEDRCSACFGPQRHLEPQGSSPARHALVELAALRAATLALDELANEAAPLAPEVECSTRFRVERLGAAHLKNGC